MQQIVIAGDSRREELARIVVRHYTPFAIVLNVSPDEQQALAGLLPFVAAMTPVSGAAVYICRDFACRAPVADAGELESVLSATKPASPVR
jgi:uncharacterized protein YyaL (SSP411 family)